jgi:hypothetical protein
MPRGSYSGFQVDPEWDGPDPLLEMAAKAHRMVPASRIAEAVASRNAEVAAAVRGLPGMTLLTADPLNVVVRAAVLAIVEPTP